MKRILILCIGLLVGVGHSAFGMISMLHGMGGYEYACGVGSVAFDSQTNTLRSLNPSSKPKEGEVIVAQIYSFREVDKTFKHLLIRPTAEGNARAEWHDDNGQKGFFLDRIDRLISEAGGGRFSIERLAFGQGIPRYFNPLKKY